MVEDGLVAKTIYPELPPRSEYCITELGKSLLPIIDLMLRWGEEHFEVFDKNTSNNRELQLTHLVRPVALVGDARGAVGAINDSAALKTEPLCCCLHSDVIRMGIKSDIVNQCRAVFDTRIKNSLCLPVVCDTVNCAIRELD